MARKRCLIAELLNQGVARAPPEYDSSIQPTKVAFNQLEIERDNKETSSMRREFLKRTMPRLVLSCALVIATGMAATSCTTTSSIDSKEDSLAAAGFTLRPANTAKRKSMLASLPPNKFFKSIHGDNVKYVYADPVICKCLYVGSQQAYGRYQQAAQQQKIANRRMLAAELYSDNNWDWNAWGPWSPGYGGFGPGLGW